jgi:hypothetical protein
MYSIVERRDKENDSTYIQEASAPTAVTIYQTCHIMYISRTHHEYATQVTMHIATTRLFLWVRQLPLVQQVLVKVTIDERTIV